MPGNFLRDATVEVCIEEREAEVAVLQQPVVPLQQLTLHAAGWPGKSGTLSLHLLRLDGI